MYINTVNSGTTKMFATGEIADISPKTDATKGSVITEIKVEIRMLVIIANKSLPKNFNFKKCFLRPSNSSFKIRMANVAVKESQREMLKTALGEIKSITVTETNRAV